MQRHIHASYALGEVVPKGTRALTLTFGHCGIIDHRITTHESQPLSHTGSDQLSISYRAMSLLMRYPCSWNAYPRATRDFSMSSFFSFLSLTLESTSPTRISSLYFTVFDEKRDQIRQKYGHVGW